MKLTTPVLLVASLLPASLSAQFENPQAKVKEIADEIAGELQQIDRLLLQTGEKGGAQAAAGAMARAAEHIDELLKQTAQSQENAAKRMDDLIKELEKLSTQGSSSSDGESRDRGQQGHQQQRSQRQRSDTPESATPDRPEGNRPEDGQDRKDPGQNAPADSVRNDPTERVDHERTYEKWGNLPEYMEFLKSRGGQPDVPEKYRKFRDAFLKQSQKSEGSGR